MSFDNNSSLDNNSRRDFLKKAPLGLGLATGVGSGLVGLDSFRRPAMANTTFFEDSGEIYSDFSEQRVRCITWKTGSGSSQVNNMELYNQNDLNHDPIYTGSLKTWRLQSESYQSLNGMVPVLYDHNGDIAWEDSDGLLINGAHNRRLDEAPDFADRYVTEGVVYDQRSNINWACWGRIRWRTYYRITSGVTMQGVVAFQVMNDDSTWQVHAAGIRDSRYARTLELLGIIRSNWNIFRGAGGTAASMLVGAGGYLAGTLTVKGGIAAAAGTAFVPAMACLGFLAILAGAFMFYAYDKAINAMQELAFLWSSFDI